MAKTKIDDLSKEIMKTLEDFKDVTIDVMNKAVTEVAKDAVDELHNANPNGSGKYGSWKDYNKGWTTKTSGKGTAKISAVIHNKTHYRLTHLLENGHALRGGGKTAAFPHIAPVADEVGEKLEKAIKEKMR